MRLLVMLVWLAGYASTVQAAKECSPALDFYKRPLAADKPVHLCDEFKDKVVLIVNTASKCAYTSQYEGLEASYAKYKDKGLVVAGFPSNDFAGQEPGSEKQIQQFCRLTYGVQFPMFEKTRVKGADADPLYKYLYSVTADAPKWNFHKYLINRQGKVVASFPSHVEPNSPVLIQAIEKLL
jgi:glutathione peroxidase